MIPSKDIKPISYVKAHASELIRQITDEQKTMIITQNGEAKVILQDIRIYEQIQESLALLKIITKSSQQIQEGHTKSVSDVFENLNRHIQEQPAA